MRRRDRGTLLLLTKARCAETNAPRPNPFPASGARRFDPPTFAILRKVVLDGASRQEVRSTKADLISSTADSGFSSRAISEFLAFAVARINSSSFS